MWKINTRDSMPDVYPWDYNFQAVQTMIPGVAVNPVSRLDLEARIATRPDFFFYDPSLTGPPPGIDFGVVPFIHQILAAVFLRGSVTYFLEIVPFVREQHHPSTLGGISSNPGFEVARVGIDDPRLAGAIQVPSRSLLGEDRFHRIDLKAAFRGVFPSVPLDGLLYTGSYMGTEQYGRDQIALNFRRLSVLAYAAGSVSTGLGKSPLVLSKSGSDLITLSWDVSCNPNDGDYEIYEGTIGNFTSHVSRYCSTGNATSLTMTPDTGSRYYLVVPANGTREGSYGLRSDGTERPQGAFACLPQQIASTCR